MYVFSLTQGIGVITKCGRQTRLSVGQAVGFMAFGAFSEYIVLSERTVMPLPVRPIVFTQ